MFEDLSLKCWGNNYEAQLGLGVALSVSQYLIGDEPGEMENSKPIFKNLKVTKVSAGFGHTCAIFKDKSVRCWGTNSEGELGISSSDYNLGSTYKPMEDLAQFKSLFPNEPTRQVVTSKTNTCVVFENGSLKCWVFVGYGLTALADSPTFNNQRSVGYGSNQLNALVPLFPNHEIIRMSAHGHSACALFEHYTVRCWGENSGSQLGRGDQSFLKGRDAVGDLPGDLNKLKPLIFEELP